MADIFDVVADPTRRALLAALRNAPTASAADGAHPERSVTELVAELQISQPTVSKHLKVLREAGLVAVREAGQRRFYRLEQAPLTSLDQWLRDVLVPEAAEVNPSRVRTQVAEMEAVAQLAAQRSVLAGADALAVWVGRTAASTAHRVKQTGAFNALRAVG